MFLASLRVFTDLIHSKEMEQSVQDAVLHIIFLLTKFPPAIRTIYILMKGDTPRPHECAALSQALYEVLSCYVPSKIIEDDCRRVFEGSRLLFGLILETADRIKLKDSPLPYLTSIAIRDLRCSGTNEPVERPLQTSLGLVEAAYYDSVCDGGLLDWNDTGMSLIESSLNSITQRAALLSGGLNSEVTTLDLDNINHLQPYGSGKEEEVIGRLPQVADLSQLASLCEMHKMGVTAPSDLPKSRAPALTLDRDGFLAVYTGRQPCGNPGKE